MFGCMLFDFTLEHFDYHRNPPNCYKELPRLIIKVFQSIKVGRFMIHAFLLLNKLSFIVRTVEHLTE